MAESGRDDLEVDDGYDLEDGLSPMKHGASGRSRTVGSEVDDDELADLLSRTDAFLDGKHDEGIGEKVLDMDEEYTPLHGQGKGTKEDDDASIEALLNDTDRLLQSADDHIASSNNPIRKIVSSPARSEAAANSKSPERKRVDQPWSVPNSPIDPANESMMTVGDYMTPTSPMTHAEAAEANVEDLLAASEQLLQFPAASEVDIDYDSKVLTEEKTVAVSEKAWSDLNRQLIRCGFSPFYFATASLDGHQDQVVLKLREVLDQYEDRGEILKSMTEARFKSDRVRQDKEDSDVQFLRVENDALKDRLADAQRDVAVMKDKIEDLTKNQNGRAQQLDTRLSNMKQMVKQYDHQLREKENEIDELKQRLERFYSEKSKNDEKDNRLFQEMFDRKPSRSSARDSATKDMISVFDVQRSEMQREIEFLRREVSTLNTALRDALNFSVDRGQVPSSGHTSPHPTQQLKEAEALLEKERRQSSRELAHARARMKELEDAKTNMQIELDSRPTASDWKEAQLTIKALQSRVSEWEQVSDIRKHLSTRELIRRDKEIHRLQLHRLEFLPKQIMKEILQDLCRELSIDDVQFLVPGVQKLGKVLKAVPRMQEFIRRVVETVTSLEESRLQKVSQTKGGGPLDAQMDEVLPILSVWKDDLKRLEELEELRTDIAALLRERIARKSDTPSERSPTLRSVDMTEMIKDLIDTEQVLLSSKQAYVNAEEYLKSRPDVITNKIINHFCKLFDVPTIEGVLPRMNQIYVTTEEHLNFLKAVRSTLRLDQNASANACLAALTRVVEHGDIREFSESYVSRELMNITGAERERELVDVVKRLKERVGLYDGVFPRVDELLKKLYYELGVQKMEDIMPAVRSVKRK